MKFRQSKDLPLTLLYHEVNAHKTITVRHNEQGGDLLFCIVNCTYICQADDLITISSAASLITTQIKSHVVSRRRYKTSE